MSKAWFLISETQESLRLSPSTFVPSYLSDPCTSFCHHFVFCLFACFCFVLFSAEEPLNGLRHCQLILPWATVTFSSDLIVGSMYPITPNAFLSDSFPFLPDLLPLSSRFTPGPTDFIWFLPTLLVVPDSQPDTQRSWLRPSSSEVLDSHPHLFSNYYILFSLSNH